MMEPDDLWARYLDEPSSGEPAAVFRRAAAAAGRKRGRQGQRRHDHGDGGAGAGDPGARMQQGATASSRELRRRSRARHPHFNVARARGFDRGLDPDGDGHRGDRRRRHVRHARAADPVPRRSGARLRRGTGARLQQLGRRLLQDRPAAPQIRRADRDARCRPGGRGGAPLRHRTGRRRGHRHAQPGQRPASARRGLRAAMGRARTSSTCRSAFTRPATPR